MKQYHGTTEKNYKKIIEEGYLKGFPILFLAIERRQAQLHGEVLLEVYFEPSEEEIKNYEESLKFTNVEAPPIQIETRRKISLSNIKRIN